MHIAQSAKTPMKAAHDVPEKFCEPNNNQRDSGAKKTITTQGVDEYISFNDIRHDFYVRKSPHDRQISSVVLNSSLSDDSSSLTTSTIDDSLTTLDGLNIDLSSSPCGFTQRSRAVGFKKVRKLGLYEKIALYEQRPDLAPFYYYAGGLLPPTPQPLPAAASNSRGVDELVLAPLDEAGDDAENRQTMIGGDVIVSVGSTDAVVNFNYRDNVPYDEEEEAREQNDCSTHCRVAADTMSLLDVASGSDSRDDDNDGIGNIRDECPSNTIGGDMTRICRIYGPRAVSSIIGCVTKEA